VEEEVGEGKEKGDKQDILFAVLIIYDYCSVA